MRWDEQAVDREDEGRLPGIGRGTVIRHFDAPEAMGINFHEVQAKSALNHVPGMRFGFNWTINSFRGCTHACTYCASPETPVLMSDRRYRPIADLVVGDRIYGTTRTPTGRRLVETEVKDHWSITKPAYRITLEDGTELVTSGEHRFLSVGGWTQVVDAGSTSLAGLGRSDARPAVSRGDHLKRDAALKVARIEPLPGEQELYDITTGTGDFIAAGVISHNCFARRTHTYLDFNAGRDFEREIVVKVNVPEVLRAELARPTWKRELVALGTNTDPYQWAESRYRFMPEIIRALHEARTPVSVLTKSPLVLRDIDLYAEMARELDVTVNLSVPTLEEEAWRATEPHTPHPKARLEAVAELKKRGIGSGVLIAPLMPGINDSPEQVEPLVKMARAAGADFLGGVALHLRDEVRDVFFGWLRAKRPDLLPTYEELYNNKRAYLPAAERARVQSVVRGWGRSRRSSKNRAGVAAGGLGLGDRPEREPRGGGTKPATGPAAPIRQESLF